jgi:hypothetical protein
MKDSKGGVAVLALNTDKTGTKTIQLPAAANRFTLTATDLNSTKVMLNGRELQVAADGSVPATDGERVAAGAVELPPLSLTFFTIPSAANQSCR